MRWGKFMMRRSTKGKKRNESRCLLDTTAHTDERWDTETCLKNIKNNHEVLQVDDCCNYFNTHLIPHQPVQRQGGKAQPCWYRNNHHSRLEKQAELQELRPNWQQISSLLPMLGWNYYSGWLKRSGPASSHRAFYIIGPVVSLQGACLLASGRRCGWRTAFVQHQ